MPVSDQRLEVVMQLSRKLPPTIAGLANAITNGPPLRDFLEPWICIREQARTVELHVREGGDVEIHVYVLGRKRNPQEALFTCDDGNLDAYTTYLAESLMAIVQKLT